MIEFYLLLIIFIGYVVKSFQVFQQIFNLQNFCKQSENHYSKERLSFHYMCVSFCLCPVMHLKIAFRDQNHGCPLTFDLVKVALNLLTMTKLESWSNNVK